jgi:PST family polysaccharide transporter
MTESRPKSFLGALKWAYAANWGEKAFSALFMFVLAAMLGPRDFGIVSMALIYISFLQMIQVQGFQTALVQRENLAAEHLDTIFWTNASLGVVFCLLSVAFGKLWAHFNHLPVLSLYVTALSACIPLQGMTVVQTALLQRSMDFRSLSVRANLSVLCGGLVGLLLAWAGMGVWALIFQQIARDLVALLLLWRLVDWRPRLRYSITHLRDLLHFSLSNFTAQLAVFIDTQGAAILMGTFFGPVAVGLYRVAERVVTSVTSVATSSIQAVSLPEFARHQSNPKALKASVLTCVRISAILTLPAMAGLMTISRPLMGIIGPQWYPAAHALQLLSILGMFFMFSMFTGPLLQALGRPGFLAVLEWCRTFFGILVLLAAGWLVHHAALEWQVTGIALARCSTGVLLVTPLYLYLLLHFGRVSAREAVAAVYPSVLSSIAIGMSFWLLRLAGLMTLPSPIFILSAQIVLGAAVAITVFLAFDRSTRNTIANWIKQWTKGPVVTKELV